MRSTCLVDVYVPALIIVICFVAFLLFVCGMWKVVSLDLFWSNILLCTIDFMLAYNSTYTNSVVFVFFWYAFILSTSILFFRENPRNRKKVGTPGWHFWEKLLIANAISKILIFTAQTNLLYSGMVLKWQLKNFLTTCFFCYLRHRHLWDATTFQYNQHSNNITSISTVLSPLVLFIQFYLSHRSRAIFLFIWLIVKFLLSAIVKHVINIKQRHCFWY